MRIQAEDLLDYLSQHAGILVSSAPREFHLIHRSFQEHLAACELTHNKPAERRPPVSPDRRFPHGLLDRACQRPDLWSNVAQLAADELLASGRRKEFWYCWETSVVLCSKMDSRPGGLAGRANCGKT